MSDPSDGEQREAAGSNEPMRAAWQSVADEFSALGSRLSQRARSDADDGTTDGADESQARAAEQAAEALRAAIDRLVAAGREVGERVGDVARDEEVRTQARRTRDSLDNALRTTVDLIEAEVNQLIARATGHATSSPPPTSEGSATWDPPDSENRVT